MCEADTKNMIVYGYFGKKKHERNRVSDLSTFFAESKHMTPTLINGSTRLRYFSTNDAENRKQI